MSAFLAQAAYRVAKLTSAQDKANDWTFEDGPLPCAFVATNKKTGEIIVNYMGQNYVEQPLTWRVRLHNWLIGLGNRLTYGEPPVGSYSNDHPDERGAWSR